MISAFRNAVVLLLAFWLVAIPQAGFAIGQAQYVNNVPSQGSFPVVRGGTPANIHVDGQDWPGVIRAANELRADVARVSGVTPGMTQNELATGANLIIIGTIGKSPLIDQLIREKKIDTAQITGKWESFLIQVVPNPLPGVANGLVIAGSDKRGTIYGIYDLSEQMGVSPWYWWADVTPDHKDSVFVKAGTVQKKNSLIDANWITLAGGLLSQGSATTYIDASATNSAAFYRITSP